MGEKKRQVRAHTLAPNLAFSAVTAPDLGFQTSRLAFLSFSSANSHDSYQPCGVLVVGRRSNKAENLAHDGAFVKVHFLSSRGIPGHRHPGPSTPGTGAPPLLRGRRGPARLQGSSFFCFLSFFFNFLLGTRFTVSRAQGSLSDVLVSGRGLRLGLLSPRTVGGSVGGCEGPGASSLHPRPLRNQVAGGSGSSARPSLLRGVFSPLPRCSAQGPEEGAELWPGPGCWDWAGGQCVVPRDHREGSWP